VGTRELKALLRVLKDAGVSKYTTSDGLTVTFRDPTPGPAESPGMAVDDGDFSGETTLDLPDGLLDPRARVEELHRRARDRGAS
jgi:hypothetical protein